MTTDDPQLQCEVDGEELKIGCLTLLSRAWKLGLK